MAVVNLLRWTSDMCDLNQLIFFVLENILFDLVFWKKKNLKTYYLNFCYFWEIFYFSVMFEKYFFKIIFKNGFWKGVFQRVIPMESWENIF